MACGGLERQVTGVALGEFPTDRQALASACRRVFCGEEDLEHARQVLPANPRAVVSNADDDAGALATRSNLCSEIIDAVDFLARAKGGDGRQ